jgi:hypothetical protein
MRYRVHTEFLVDRTKTGGIIARSKDVLGRPFNGIEAGTFGVY